MMNRNESFHQPTPHQTGWHLVISLLLLFGLTLASKAQNRIDRFVDSESTIGQSKFTSVVERDPETREVIRVVKVRELTRGIDINACLATFVAEQASGRFTHKTEDGEQHTIILAVDGERQNRIYMLQYKGQRPMHATDGKVTIVIRMRNEK